MLTLFFGQCKPLTKESEIFLKAQALTFSEVQQNVLSSRGGQPLPLSFTKPARTLEMRLSEALSAGIALQTLKSMGVLFQWDQSSQS